MGFVASIEICMFYQETEGYRTRVLHESANTKDSDEFKKWITKCDTSNET